MISQYSELSLSAFAFVDSWLHGPKNDERCKTSSCGVLIDLQFDANSDVCTSERGIVAVS